MVEDPGRHRVNTTHVDASAFKVREYVQRRRVEVRWIPTGECLGDIFTKHTIEADQFFRLWHTLCGYRSWSVLEEITGKAAAVAVMVEVGHFLGGSPPQLNRHPEPLKWFPAGVPPIEPPCPAQPEPPPAGARPGALGGRPQARQPGSTPRRGGCMLLRHRLEVLDGRYGGDDHRRWASRHRSCSPHPMWRSDAD